MPKMIVVHNSTDKYVDIHTLAIGETFEDMYGDVYIKMHHLSDAMHTYDAVRLSDGKLHVESEAAEIVYPVKATLSYTRICNKETEE